MSIVGPDVHGPQRLLRTPRMSRSVEKHLATTARRRERLGSGGWSVPTAATGQRLGRDECGRPQ